MDIKELLPLMQQYKVKRVKLGALEVELDAVAFAAAPAPAEKPPAPPEIPSMPENFLFYSVPDQSPLIQFERADVTPKPPAPEAKS
jgi:hypothetical protein